MGKHLLLILILLFSYPLSLPVWAGEENSIVIAIAEPETIPDIKASLVVSSPGKNIYSAFGHCALRMECPQFDLDYCYDQKIESSIRSYVEFLFGTACAAVVALPTDEYLQPYREEGRQVVQYELNFSPLQKQMLWSYLDEELERGPYADYNLITTNCISLILKSIKAVTVNESLDMSHQPEELAMINGDLLRFYSRESPWTQFVYVLAFAYVCDYHYQLHLRLAPETLIQLLQQATLTDAQGSTRQLLSATGEEILPLTSPIATSPFTPTCVLSILLVIIMLLSVFEKKWRLAPVMKCLDVVLLIATAVIGTLLLMICISAGSLLSHWNWYLVLFNPIPLVLWLLLRNRSWYHRFYYLYLAVLVLFIAFTPFTTQLDWTHQLLTAILLVRVGTKIMQHKISYNGRLC